MSQLTEGTELPKSVRHKRILDLAEEQPEASMSELAAEVPSATTELVERVLEQYGDPAQTTAEESSSETGPQDREEHTTATEQTGDRNDSTGQADDSEPATAEMTEEQEPDEPAAETSQQASDADQSYPSRSDLTMKEVETLRAIADNPDANQREIAEMLDVSPSTVSTRLSKVEGFDWEDRATFVDAVLEPPATDTDSNGMDSNNTELHATVEQFEERLTAIEQELDESQSATASSALEDPELVHKVLHACMESDVISEDEELEILEAVVS